MNKILVLSIITIGLCTVLASADTFGTGANQFEIDFVPISGSTNPTSGYGILNSDYRMGTYEITNDQFAKFASNNPYFTDGGVSANKVTWFEAVLFVNYLNTSKGYQAAYKFTDGNFTIWDVTETDGTNLYPSGSKSCCPS